MTAATALCVLALCAMLCAAIFGVPRLRRRLRRAAIEIALSASYGAVEKRLASIGVPRGAVAALLGAQSAR